jgi:hypothetical protein
MPEDDSTLPSTTFVDQTRKRKKDACVVDFPRPVCGWVPKPTAAPKSKSATVNPSFSRPLGLVLPATIRDTVCISQSSPPRRGTLFGTGKSTGWYLLGLGQPPAYLHQPFSSLLPLSCFFTQHHPVSQNPSLPCSPSSLLPLLPLLAHLPFFFFPPSLPPSLLPFILHHPHSRKSLFLLPLPLPPSVPLSPVIFPSFLRAATGPLATSYRPSGAINLPDHACEPVLLQFRPVSIDPLLSSPPTARSAPCNQLSRSGSCHSIHASHLASSTVSR